MATWKKIIVSGSNAHLSSVTASNGSIVSGSLTMSGSIGNPDYIDFRQAETAGIVAGRMEWNTGDGTLDLGLSGGNVTLQVGQQTYARIYNAEATTLNKGEVVYISGSQGNRIAAKRASSVAESGSSNTLGFVAETITAGSDGFIITNGTLKGLDTTGLTDGFLLYLSSSAGQYSTTPTVAPNHTVILGYVERVHASAGSIYVKVDNGYELGELHNVLTNGASYGDLLMRSGSLWTHSKQLTGSYGLTGSLQATSFTGSLQGTATTASYVLNAVSSSFASNSLTASYYGGAVTSASYATTASYVLNAVSSSFAANSLTASYWSGTVTSASYSETASYWSGTVTSASYALNSTSASYSSQEFVNVETLSFNKTLTTNDKPIQILTTSGVNRTITLPTTGTPDGFKFEIWNNDAYTSANYLTITPSDQHYIPAKCKAILRYDSAAATWVTDGARNIVLGGSNYSNYNGAIAIGFGNYSNYIGGIGIGNGSLGNYSYGVGLGYAAYYNYSYGVGIGYGSYNNYDYGIGIGYSANDNRNYGIGIGRSSTVNRDYAIGIGYQASYNLSYGIGIGYLAQYNDTYGIGIGFQAQNASSYGIAIGFIANANSKGTGTVVIGSYTKAERQNEFVTTGTDSTVNKAQSIIQKFKNKALSSASSAFQEIFTDASSGRLTILASSIYQFRIQINAIEATGFKCKTWEITGAVKRDASNNTTMVGGSPTYYVTSEDSGTSNWDVKVTANDTNEALKIEVKHDSANNVTFSATVWATETRL